MRRKSLLLAMLICSDLSAATPEADLLTEAPPLAALLRQYGNYRPTLEEYAVKQGFSQPYEKLATITHELIHIHSATHAGYWINGAEFLRPYVTQQQAWTSITNSDILSYLKVGPIATSYARNTPKNNLSNCLDEINAYTHVIGFVAAHEPESLSKQLTALQGHVQMVEVYLEQLSIRGEKLHPETQIVVSRIMNYARTAIRRFK